MKKKYLFPLKTHLCSVSILIAPAPYGIHYFEKSDLEADGFIAPLVKR